MRYFPLLVILLFTGLDTFAQRYHAGFLSIQLQDTARIYKPNTDQGDSLHYRPVELDIWYPSEEQGNSELVFEDLFSLLEKRATKYQDGQDFSGMTEELAQFYVAQLGIGTDGKNLLDIPTESYSDLSFPDSTHPVILYMAGFNGMGFENYKVLEELAQRGYLVISIWSVGRYPGDMTNELEDMMEQVLDAEFAVAYLKKKGIVSGNFEKIGILAYSWGGMSAAAFIARNPDTKAFVSWDGTESHYFGESEMDDRAIQKIYDSKLLKPERLKIPYLYLESGDKLDNFTPSESYNYFEKSEAEKYYLRIRNSKHSDFFVIPSILNASANSVNIYEQIKNATVLFFNKALMDQENFSSYWASLKSQDNITDQLFSLPDQEKSELEFSGSIIDSNNDKPIPYVNIGVLNKGIGTVSGPKGEFSLSLTKQFIKDTIRISAIGYKSIEFPIQKLMFEEMPLSIHLEERFGELDEVVVSTERLKSKTLGNKTQSKFMSTGFSYDQLGAEMGIKINIRNTPTLVEAFNFHVSYNRLSAPSVFRLNFYQVEQGKPGRNILRENILVKIAPNQTGEISMDLQPYHIVLTEDVIVALEWVESEGENKEGEAIFFSLGLFNSGTLYKKSSQSEFRKHSSLGVGFNLDVSIL